MQLGDPRAALELAGRVKLGNGWFGREFGPNLVQCCGFQGALSGTRENHK